MQNGWSLLGAIVGNVSHVEILGLIEVQLHGGELPFSANRIFDHDVYLGTVESGFSFLDRIGLAPILSRIYEDVFRFIPKLIVSEIFFFVLWIADRNLNSEIIKFKDVKNCSH